MPTGPAEAGIVTRATGTHCPCLNGCDRCYGSRAIVSAITVGRVILAGRKCRLQSRSRRQPCRKSRCGRTMEAGG
ncbi:hypothetical protein FRAAL4701 [Frankia alni ACN14a]|uniref:Uncharacterized protein n=1 Tax=Frankia alni (strain DSM 45986 / CECT 9034 / ACN14a) TaxID=326424 RepID=Q0RAK9_FRAAA|nr:hypothetical protein FRAAL4701 [Frankia alni ACN14a]